MHVEQVTKSRAFQKGVLCFFSSDRYLSYIVSVNRVIGHHGICGRLQPFTAKEPRMLDATLLHSG